jgi:hypothetical protein
MIRAVENNIMPLVETQQGRTQPFADFFFVLSFFVCGYVVGFYNPHKEDFGGTRKKK